MRYLTAAAIALVPFVAQAQQQCGPADAVIEYLGDKHRESPVATMMRGPERVIIFATEDGTTWTMVIQRDTLLCMVAEGQGWQPIRFMSPGRKS